MIHRASCAGQFPRRAVLATVRAIGDVSQSDTAYADRFRIVATSGCDTPGCEWWRRHGIGVDRQRVADGDEREAKVFRQPRLQPFHLIRQQGVDTGVSNRRRRIATDHHAGALYGANGKAQRGEASELSESASDCGRILGDESR